jgi:hypothetical protein
MSIIEKCSTLAVAMTLFACNAAMAGVPSECDTVGLITSCEPASCSDGYKLFAPLNGTQTYLIDNDGLVINEWLDEYPAGNALYMLENGTLLRCSDNGPVDGGPAAGGDGGCVSIFDWDNTLLWRWCYNTAENRLHHDIEPLPNGNILMISWEVKSTQEALDAGRDPAYITDADGEVWPLVIIEVEPDLNTPDQGTIVWEWKLWDHVIQDFDSTKPNFGVIADEPAKVNLNDGRDGRADWIHANSIDYNETLDQILISTPFYNEMWIINHALTPQEAATDAGDLMYRWGNPVAYGRGTVDDQRSFFQHDARWIPEGHPGAGNITFYNNGQNRPDGLYSTADELVTPLLNDGTYDLAEGEAYGPAESIVIYQADIPTDMYSSGLSGVERIANGNTLICQGRGSGTDPANGKFIEVNDAGEVVWFYINPATPIGPMIQGDAPINQKAFRCSHYPSDYAGFAGKDMTPGNTVELDRCGGDVDFDGDSDVNDILAIIEAFGSEGSSNTDVNCSGAVTVDDLLQAIGNFGGC